MLSTKVKLYKSLFHKSFFFDKFLIKNIFQCPKITYLQLKFFVSSRSIENKFQFTKMILFFYLLTGQYPQLLTRYSNLRNTQRKKIIGLHITVHNYMFFLNFLVFRQLTLLTPAYKNLHIISSKTLTLNLSHKVHDDDFFYQALKIAELLKYQVTINSNALTKSQFQTLLVNFKIPCTFNL